MILKMRIQDWVKELKQTEPQSPHSGRRPKFQVINNLIRPYSLSLEQKQIKHGKLYPWLRDFCGLQGIETVGDLIKVFQAAPVPSPTAEQVPWKWFGQGRNGAPFSVFRAREILVRKGLL